MAAVKEKEKNSLVEVFSELLILATELKGQKDYGEIGVFRQRIIEMFGAADQKGKNIGIPVETLLQARYAVAAFLDETILSSAWPNKNEWSARSLQFEFFKEHLAGVEFFNRLEGIRSSFPTNFDLLEIYHICLILGFEGQYKIHGREKLKGVIDELSRQIQEKRGELPPLSPYGEKPDELIEAIKRGIPSWVIVVSSIAVVFFFYLTLSFMINHDTKNVKRDLNQLMEGLR